MKNEIGTRTMKHPVFFGTLLTLLFVLGSCEDPMNQLRGLAQAKFGLDSLVAELSLPANFDLIKIEYFQSSDSAFGKTCYYASANLIVASSLSLTQAIDAYTERSHLSGWMLEGRQYESARSLIRGENAQLVIESAKPGTVMKSEEIVKLQTSYKSVIFVRVVYMVPRREGC